MFETAKLGFKRLFLYQSVNKSKPRKIFKFFFYVKCHVGKGVRKVGKKFDVLFGWQLTCEGDGVHVDGLPFELAVLDGHDLLNEDVPQRLDDVTLILTERNDN